MSKKHANFFIERNPFSWKTNSYYTFSTFYEKLRNLEQFFSATGKHYYGNQFLSFDYSIGINTKGNQQWWMVKEDLQNIFITIFLWKNNLQLLSHVKSWKRTIFRPLSKKDLKVWKIMILNFEDSNSCFFT